jgi:hypothetical protein
MLDVDELTIQFQVPESSHGYGEFRMGVDFHKQFCVPVTDRWCDAVIALWCIRRIVRLENGHLITLHHLRFCLRDFPGKRFPQSFCFWFGKLP